MSTLRFEVLGPVRGWHDDAELELGSPQQRAVLAVLLLAQGWQVSLDGLVDALWGQEPAVEFVVMLVAQGHTNAQIAAQRFISIRTVTSHLDRIRDKTGCRRRADLTRLALREGLV